MASSRQVLGAAGEDAVAAWYASRGYTVVARNWRAGRTGEIDIVARFGSTCAICEVKTRTTSAFGTGFEAVTFDKQRRLRRLAAAWLAAQAPGEWLDVRFDVASVNAAGDVELIESAF